MNFRPFAANSYRRAFCSRSKLSAGAVWGRASKVKYRSVGELHKSIFREAPFYIAGERLSSEKVSGKSQGKAGGVFDVGALGELQRHHSGAFPLSSIAVNGFCATRQMGGGEIYKGKKDKFLTVVCNLETGEPLWFGRERKKETLE